MRAVVQRVSRAAVEVDGFVTAQIGVGLVALVGVTHADTMATAVRLAQKIFSLRIMRGERSLAEVAGASILVVSQFTLYGDARKGRRPTWAAAAPAPAAAPIIDAVLAELRRLGADAATGVFGADMSVDLVNDGPFTVLVEL